MGQSVYPSLPGIAFNVQRKSEFKTFTQRAVSGRELRGTYQAFPLTTFKIDYEFLSNDGVNFDIQTLVGFFLSRQGSFDSFLFTDPLDSTVTAQSFGQGDGATTAFQLSRSFGAGGSTFAEPVQNVNGTPSIYVNGTLQTAGTNYTIGSTGMVTFVSAPAINATLTWTGNYYYRCRFTTDTINPTQLMLQFWEGKGVEFIGAIGNRV